MVYVHAKDWTLWETTQLMSRQFYPTDCHLVGWLVQEDRDKIVISMEYYPSPDGDEVRHIISMPKSCVESMWGLEKNELIWSKRIMDAKKD